MKAKMQPGVEQQRAVGEEAGQAVVDQHEEHDQAEADDAGAEAIGEGLLAEGRGELVEAVYGERQGQRAVFEHGGEVLGVGDVADAGDLAAAGDLALDGGRLDDLVVEDDGEVLADVRSGVGGEVGCGRCRGC